MLTAAGIEATQAPLIGHHQLTVGLLRANLLSPNARIVIAGSEAARGDVPLFSYTDVAALDVYKRQVLPFNLRENSSFNWLSFPGARHPELQKRSSRFRCCLRAG